MKRLYICLLTLTLVTFGGALTPLSAQAASVSVDCGKVKAQVLAFEAGLHRTFVAHVERLARNIALDNIERLAKALGVEPYELLKPGRE